MDDLGHIETNAALSDLEARIGGVYSQALSEMQAKQSAFIEEYAKELDKMQSAFEAGNITEKEFRGWIEKSVMTSDWYQEMIEALSNDLANADVKAMALVNGTVPDVYCINSAYGAFMADSMVKGGVSFALVDRHTVARLIKDGSISLLPVKLNIEASKRWNKQHINGAILQGLIQGESIPKMAARLQGAVNMDMNAAIRTARTATTCAQSSGRLDSFREAKAEGVDIKKTWLATMDKRTRDSHVRCDGETVDIEDKFSNGLQYPGDPNGDPSEIYNCRCTVIATINGKTFDGTRLNKTGMSYDDWKANAGL